MNLSINNCIGNKSAVAKKEILTRFQLEIHNSFSNFKDQ